MNVLVDSRVDCTQSRILPRASISCLFVLCIFRYQQAHGNVPAALSSMEDMQNFVENFPQFKKQSHSVNKHVALISACKDAVDALDLFTISKIEQNVACAPEDQPKHFESVLGAMQTLLHSLDPGVSASAVKAASEAAIRLSLLYILRYPTDQTGISQLEQFLSTVPVGNFEGLPRLQLRLLRMIRSYAKVCPMIHACTNPHLCQQLNHAQSSCDRIVELHFRCLWKGIFDFEWKGNVRQRQQRFEKGESHCKPRQNRHHWC